MTDRSPAERVALDCVEAGIEAAHPRTVIPTAVTLDDDRLGVGGASYDLSDYDEVVVVGGGKAAGTAVLALEGVLEDRLTGGVVVAPEPVDTRTVEVLQGDHPLPSERSVEATRRVIESAAAAGERTLVLAVITGGGSALLAAPAEGIALEELQRVTRTLLDRGAGIDELNAVRKHLSAVKGGRLAAMAAPATVVGILISDVVGDDPGVIASGPTAPDDTTFADALAVLDRYQIDEPHLSDRLEAGVTGAIPETPRAGDPVFDRVDVHVVASGRTALEAARGVARSQGYGALLLSSLVCGEAREAGRFHAAIAEECRETGNPATPPAVVLSGGETTVTVRGEGRGGPNLEFALAAALDLEAADVAIAAVDTDGLDGSTEAAGAVVSADTVDDATAAQAALDDNDAYAYLASRGALVETGPTGTNVNDLRVVVVA